MTRRWAPQTCFKLRRNTAGKMKDFIYLKKKNILINRNLGSVMCDREAIKNTVSIKTFNFFQNFALENLS